MIWCFDPGAVFTGVAATLENGWVSHWGQFSDPIEALEYASEDLKWQDHILIEDYSHGGSFTKEAKQTLEVIGFLRYSLVREGHTVILRHKDKRLSGQSEAASMMDGTIADLKKDPARKDAFSALAHCITYAREL